MNVLYIGPFTTSSFRARHGEMNPHSLGGIRKVSLIIQALAQQGHQVVVLSSAILSNSRLAWRTPVREQLESANGSVTVIYPSALMLRPLGSLLNSFRAASLIRQLLAEFVPDAAITYNSNLFESLSAKELVRLRGTPIILQIEDLPLARQREWMNIKARLDQQCWDRMLNLASAFTAVNSFILDMLPGDKPKYLLPGIIDQQLLECSQVRPVPFSGSQRTLGYFGGLTPGKGLEVLLDLVPQLPSPWRLVMTGSGPLASNFELLSKQYPDRLTFLGLVSDLQLYEAMCACDCTVIPREQIMNGGQGVFPFKAFEYLVSGSHVIAYPLAPLADHDLSFIHRWDGSVNSLLAALSRGDIEFRREQSNREKAVAMILSRYSHTGIVELFAKLLSRITGNRHQ